jgi:hypothetical protein
MRDFELGRATLSISLAGALLSACGGSSVLVASDNMVGGATGPKHHQTFVYSGTKQTFIVPAGVTRLTVVARGGEGTGYFIHGQGTPGFPGRVYAVVRVRSGDKLYVFVAGAGDDGGFNGGAVPGGGGASDVRIGGDTLKHRIIVAAGGGGSGGCDLYCYADGGDGGGLNGKRGSGFSTGLDGSGGGGGTQSAGGSGGAGGVGHQSNGNGQLGDNGALGLGGNGGAGGQTSGSGYYSGIAGGGGGGGYFGGGGGGGSASLPTSGLDIGSGGGGGGSSYVEPSAITSRMWTGWRATGKGDGQVIFSWK